MLSGLLLNVALYAVLRFKMLLAANPEALTPGPLMMVMGLAPVVGIPLPFMSHGGSSMMTNMICIGTLMMINRWNRESPRSGLIS